MMYGINFSVYCTKNKMCKVCIIRKHYEIIYIVRYLRDTNFWSMKTQLLFYKVTYKNKFHRMNANNKNIFFIIIRNVLSSRCHPYFKLHIFIIFFKYDAAFLFPLPLLTPRKIYKKQHLVFCITIDCTKEKKKRV